MKIFIFLSFSKSALVRTESYFENNIEKYTKPTPETVMISEIRALKENNKYSKAL